MQFRLIGLGRMGANMVRRLMTKGHKCVVYDRAPEMVAKLAKEGATGSASLAEVVQKLKKPRSLCLMVPAAFVDAAIEELVPLLERDDTIIDGGNSHYHDDIARAKRLRAKGIHYVDMGTSGGGWGLERGDWLLLGGRGRRVRKPRGADRQAPRPRPRRHPAHAGTREARGDRGDGLPPLRSRGGRPL